MEATILRWTPRIALVTSVIVIGLCAVSIYILTHYEAETACSNAPTSKECQQIKVASDKARSIHSACVITRRAGLGCPAAERKKNARQQTSRSGSQPNPDPRSGPSPSEPSGPAGGDVGNGSTQPSPDPSPPPPGPPTNPPPPPPPGTGNPPLQPPSQGPISGLGSGLNNTVDSAQNAAQGLLDDVQGSTCKLGVLC